LRSLAPSLAFYLNLDRRSKQQPAAHRPLRAEGIAAIKRPLLFGAVVSVFLSFSTTSFGQTWTSIGSDVDKWQYYIALDETGRSGDDVYAWVKIVHPAPTWDTGSSKFYTSL
jgi:hypothetical protein